MRKRGRLTGPVYLNHNEPHQQIENIPTAGNAANNSIFANPHAQFSAIAA